MKLPKIAITLGDPAGIGPEVVYKSIHNAELRKLCRPVLIGGASSAKALGFDFGKTSCEFIDIGERNTARIRPGRENAASGESAYSCIIKAVELAQAGLVDAIATAPISKAALKAAGHNYSGHTELLAKLTKTNDFAMLMAAKGLRVVMVTRHLPISRISGNLTIKDIITNTILSSNFLKHKAGIKAPRIGVLALNPHAGEKGLLGDEEEKIIIPAIKKLKKMGVRASGPYPSDSAWLKNKNGEFDLMVAMYHDQAMIGLKLLAHEYLVNVTLGLPFIRTSPGHGTANDIAGKGIADPAPMIESIKFAAKYR